MTFKIAVGDSESALLNVPFPIIALIIPAGMEGNQIAFSWSPDSAAANAEPVYSGANELRLDAGADRAVLVNPQTNRIKGYVKLRTLTTGVAEPQVTADLDIYAVTDPRA